MNDTVIPMAALSQAAKYLNEDKDAHLKAHGKWNLDAGKLQAALEHGRNQLQIIRAAHS